MLQCPTCYFSMTNYSRQNDSTDCSSYLPTGEWTLAKPEICFTAAEIIVTLFGILHNSLFLLISYRLKWFKYCQYFLICNQAVADWTSSVFWCFESTRHMITALTDAIPVELNGTCQDAVQVAATYFSDLPASIAINASQKSAIAIGFDRLFLLLFPHTWVKLSVSYRFSLIVIVWLWAVFEQIVPLLYAYVETQGRGLVDMVAYAIRFNTRVIPFLQLADSVCLGFLSIAAPFASATFCRRAMNGNGAVSVFCGGMEGVNRRIIKRVNILACLTIVSHLFLSLAIVAITLNLGEPATGITIPIVLSYAIWPMYIFAWKDDTFRGELKKILAECRRTKCCGNPIGEVGPRESA